MPGDVTVPYTDSKKTRFDVWLASFLHISRSKAAQRIRDGVARVNEKKEKPNTILRSGDIVSMSTNNPQVEGTDEKKIQIVAETNDYIIIGKPNGLVVHATLQREIGKDTVVEQVCTHYPNICSVGESALRPGIVHRLDKEVSGIMVVAKNQDAYTHLKRQFQHRLLRKCYLALVGGSVQKSHGVIHRSLIRSSIFGKYRVTHTSDSIGARTAETAFDCIIHTPTTSLLALFPKTGRTHQLRVHMQWFGHPIIGDRLYGNRTYIRRSEAAQRLFLHAYFLEFTDRTGERIRYSVPPPEDFVAIASKSTGQSVFDFLQKIGRIK